MKAQRLYIYIAGVSAVLLGLLMLCVPFISEGVQEPGDGLQHYFISKYSWNHPELFLDHWGKPLFTLLSSPFAQFGFPGMVVFNVLLFGITIYFLVKIAKHYNWSHFWILPFLLFLSPVYFEMVIGGMTEILFGTIVAASIYYLVTGKFRLGAIIFSFIIFTRPEGLVVFPFFALFILLKSPKNLPFLLTGFLIYSLAGWAHYDSFLWFFTKSPYTGAAHIYGSGDLLHFADKYREIIGKPISLALITGIALVLFKVLKNIFRGKKDELFSSSVFWFLLVLFPLIAVFSVHSYLWWKGLKGSLGLIRVFATVVPLVGIIIVYGIHYIFGYIQQMTQALKSKSGWISVIILAGFIGLSAMEWRKQVEVPVKVNRIDKVVGEAATWYKSQNFNAHVAYLHPYFAYKADIDPFDKEKVTLLWSINDQMPSSGLKPGDIIVWDAHFGPNEGGVKLQKLKDDPRLKLIKAFFPERKITVLGGHEFGVYIYKVVEKGMASIEEEKELIWMPFKDKSVQISSEEEFYNVLHENIWVDDAAFLEVVITGKIRFPENYEAENLQLIVEQKYNGERNYLAEKINGVDTGKWNDIRYFFKLNSESSELVVYFWNFAKKEYTIDQFQIKLKKK